MDSETLPLTPDDLKQPEHRQLLNAIFAAMAARVISQRDVVLPSDGSAPMRWDRIWFKEDQAARLVRRAIDSFPEADPEQVYRFASEWAGSEHPMPPFATIYPESAPSPAPPSR